MKKTISSARSRTSFASLPLAALLCLDLAAAAALAAQEPAEPTRVLILDASGKESAFLRFLASSPGLKTAAASRLSAVAQELDRAEVLMVDAGAMEPDQAAAIEEQVRAGRRLVVAGRLPEQIAGSGAWRSLLGIRKTARTSPRAENLLVLVPDQSHPVTQCLPHFQHAGFADEHELEGGVSVFLKTAPEAAAGAAAGSPAAWSRRLGKGAVVVSLLDWKEGPSRDAVRFILARAAQWSAGEAVTVPIAGDFRLLAERLLKDAGPAIPFKDSEGFFLGREVALAMSFQGADWLVRADREETEQPEKVLDKLRLRPGDAIADLGAGVGYFTLRMARRVRPNGRVLAVEIQEEMLQMLKERAGKEDLQNIELVLAGENDPRLPANALDMVFMADVYHELAKPAPVLESVKKSLREKGRLVLVEYRGEDPRVPIKPLHRTLAKQVKAELDYLGFKWQETLDFLPHQHIHIFSKKP